MAKKKTKLEKMSKKERTSLAYALSTNLAKHGKPQTPKNERKLTKGEINKKEKHMGEFKKAFDLEESILMALAQQAMKNRGVTPRTSRRTAQDELEPGYNFYTGKTEPVNKVKEELKNPKKADLNKDGKLSSYEKTRGAAIEKNINEAPGSTLTLSQSDMDKLHKDGKLEIDGHKILFKMNEDLDLGHQDNEPHMLKKDLYRIAKYAAELYKMVNQFDAEGQEVDFPHWWQAKIITSKEAMVKAKHYLDGELTVPQIDAMLEEEMDINDPFLVRMRADKMKREKGDFGKEYGDAVKKAYSNNNNDTKLRFLKKERAQLMNDMEQEAEPEGGPIADRYGAELNRIDKAITKLSGRQKMTYNQAIK